MPLQLGDLRKLAVRRLTSRHGVECNHMTIFGVNFLSCLKAVRSFGNRASISVLSWALMMRHNELVVVR